MTAEAATLFMLVRFQPDPMLWQCLIEQSDIVIEQSVAGVLDYWLNIPI